MQMPYSEYDSYLFHEGTHHSAYEFMGAHITEEKGVPGTEFVLWAPSAINVHVICETYGWDENAWPMNKGKDGIFTAFVPNVKKGDKYKYLIEGADNVKRYKADPYAFYSELRPGNASVVWDSSDYLWHDSNYYINKVNKTVLTASETKAANRNTDTEKITETDTTIEIRRNDTNTYLSPMAIYEVHLGSWKKDYRLNNDGFLNYRQLADELSEYVMYMGFTHVELIGICEHPFDGSWGYQCTGYFSPTSRYGVPEDLKYFIDKMHENGIGVIIDWVPAHFPKDDFSLSLFDGTRLYESEDPLLREYPEWGTYAFDHSRPEIRSFLISSACYLINEFHADALRVDAVAAMLYTNFSRNEYRPNRFGGVENLESIEFLKQLNTAVKNETKGFLIAEDSSKMEKITVPVEDGGLGFTYKWSLGWMNDTLKYFSKDPLFKGYHHGELTHTADYAFDEHYILVLSHDEVVHLKKPMLKKMPGTKEDEFGALKCLYTYLLTSPGKKLLFMGQEFAEEHEWIEDTIVDWGLTNDMWHRDVLECVRRLLSIYKTYPCLYTDTGDKNTFEWVNRNDAMRSTISYIRRNPWNYDGAVLAICNFTPLPINDYTCGVPVKGEYKRIFSTYDSLPGSGKTSEETLPIMYKNKKCDGYDYMISYGLRPYESLLLKIPGAENHAIK